MQEQLSISKYVYHKSGLPIRLPPEIRGWLRQSDPRAPLRIQMIQEDPYLGVRSEEDIPPSNLGETIRLRKVARLASRELVSYAEKWGISRYCTIIHGSVAKGLVRGSCSLDPSDVDVDLVVDSTKIPKTERLQVRESMYQNSPTYGARLDSYVYTLDEVKSSVAAYARFYLRSAAYAVVNINMLWEEICSMGIAVQQYTNLEPKQRKNLRSALKRIQEGSDAEEAILNPDSIAGRRTHAFLVSEDLINHPDPQLVHERASYLYGILTNTRGKK